jgi:plasmid segregation protein ParM
VAAAAPILASSDYEAGPYLIVDIGYRTTDYIVVIKTASNGFDFDPDAAGSLERGMHAVGKQVAKALSEEYQVPFSASELEAQDPVFVRGEKIDVTYRFHEARQIIGRRIAQELATALGPQIDKLRGIVAVGGGSDLLAALLPGTIVPPDPQWANVSGYYLSLDLSHTPAH